jgi:hypothetical protein
MRDTDGPSAHACSTEYGCASRALPSRPTGERAPEVRALVAGLRTRGHVLPTGHRFPGMRPWRMTAPCVHSRREAVPSAGPVWTRAFATTRSQTGDGVRSRSPLRGSPGFAPGSLLTATPSRAVAAGSDGLAGRRNHQRGRGYILGPTTPWNPRCGVSCVVSRVNAGHARDSSPHPSVRVGTNAGPPVVGSVRCERSFIPRRSPRLDGRLCSP